MAARVQLRLGERVVSDVAFSGAELRIGRMKENDIVINNLAVSRFHAVLRRVGDVFQLEDLGSENGSFVNGVAVNGTALVPSGAEITIGKHSLRIHGTGHPVMAPPRAGRSDAWDASKTYFAPELTPRPKRRGEEEAEAVAVDAESGDDEIPMAEPADDSDAETEEASGASTPRAALASLDLPDPDGIFAFGEEDLVGAAAPDPVAAQASAVALDADAFAPPAPAPPAASAPPGETGGQTSLFDFGLGRDLGASGPPVMPPGHPLPPVAAPASGPVATPASAPVATPAASAPPALHVGLIVERAGRVERVVPWSADELVVGRAPGCTLVLAGAGVSRRHARFLREGARHRVLDLGSANGVSVNGERVADRTLAPGDVVTLDEYTLTFVVDRQPVDAAVRAAPAPAGEAGRATVLAMPENDLVTAAEEEEGWEKELESAAVVLPSAPAKGEAAVLRDYVVEVAIALDQLPPELRAAVGELSQQGELRLPAQLRLRRRR
jgi:pSer/pThr/pTyr-binding forkhead associated (FHA) protein